MKSDSRNLREYEAIVRTWLLDWNKLEEDTRVFLPIAEYLYDSVRDIGSEDYSPFVVQYCRSLENEILRKLFEAYHEYLGQNPAKKSAIVAEDLTDRTSNANLFARNIDRDRRDYTLGQMSRVLQLIKPGGNTLQGSDLLQDFREFVVERFGPQLADVDFASSVQDITDNYRNRSAHPYVLDFETAQQCQPLVRQTLCDFLYFYNRST